MRNAEREIMYKVVYLDQDGKLRTTSGMITGWKVIYPPGVRVTARIASSGLFCFKDLEDARRFAFLDGGDEVWECKGENARPISRCAVLANWAFEAYWKGELLHQMTIECPPGTYIVDAVTLLSKKGGR